MNRKLIILLIGQKGSGKSFVGSLLETELKIKFIRVENWAKEIKQTIYQVIMHSTYHRGQINKEIRRIGGEPPLTDFIYWIWLSKPEAETILK